MKTINLSEIQRRVVKSLQMYGSTIRVHFDYDTGKRIYWLDSWKYPQYEQRIGSPTIAALVRKSVLVEGMMNGQPACRLTEEWKV